MIIEQIADLDFFQLFESVHLPSDKSIIIRVSICRHETSPPVDSGAKIGEISLGQGREEFPKNTISKVSLPTRKPPALTTSTGDQQKDEFPGPEYQSLS
jgi:hypothetical protein